MTNQPVKCEVQTSMLREGKKKGRSKVSKCNQLAVTEVEIRGKLTFVCKKHRSQGH